MEKLAEKITKHMIKKQIIKEEQNEEYFYCFVILLSTFTNVVVLITVGIIFSQVVFAILFAICFVILRHIAGGYHAKRHLTCICSIAMFTLIGAICISYIPVNYIEIISIALGVVSIIIFLLLAPVDNVNKPLSFKEVKVKRKQSICGIMAFGSIALMLSIAKIDFVYAFSVIYAIAIVSLLLAIGLKSAMT